MLNDTDRAKYALPEKAKRAETLVERADQAVDIRDIMKQMGLWAPSGMFYSYKIDCPWSYEHSDGGRDKNCRLFGSTNIYCWALHGYVTPTMLHSRWKGIPRKASAEILLEERNLLSKNWREKWRDLEVERENNLHPKLGAKSDIIAALHTALETDVEYVAHEFDLPVRSKWKDVLEVLDTLWTFPNTGLQELQQFHDASLIALRRAARIKV